MPKRSIILFIHNSYKDPLFSGTVLSYLKHIPVQPHLSFHLITYEQVEFKTSKAERKNIRMDLSKYNVRWHPLTYHRGTFLIPKIYDFLVGFLLTGWIRLRHNSSAILALANVAGGFSFIYGKLLGMKIILYQYEPHSEFLKDFGSWKSSGIKFRLLNKIEKTMGINSDFVLSGTSAMDQRLKQWGSRASILKVPTCVNEDKFIFSPEAREQIRKSLNIQDKKVFIYPGKFGGIYYKEEIAELCRILHDEFPDSFFLILTSNDKQEVSDMFLKKGLKESAFHISFSPYEKIQDYLSAADLGIVAIPPLPSQVFRSPVKVGEYLMCGLPYLVCKGISDDDSLALKNKVGVVVNSFTDTDIRAIIPSVRYLLGEEKNALRTRCRKAGIDYRSKQIAVKALENIFQSTDLAKLT